MIVAIHPGLGSAVSGSDPVIQPGRTFAGSFSGSQGQFQS
ncbi:MAG: hypothetical protein ACI9VS_003669, partial [Candidatus Binatia bacterium]